MCCARKVFLTTLISIDPARSEIFRAKIVARAVYFFLYAIKNPSSNKP